MRIRASIMFSAGLVALSSSAFLFAQVKEAKAAAIKAPDANWKVPKTPWGTPICKACGPATICKGFPSSAPRNTARAVFSPRRRWRSVMRALDA